jgi:hypothetical protein
MKRHIHDQVGDFTRKLMSDPLSSSLFLHPVDLGNELANAQYRTIVGQPMDLTHVQTSLKDREYSFDNWCTDVRAIFDNAITYNGNGSYITGVAQYFRAKLDKLVVHITRKSDAAYMAALGTAFAGYVDILSRPPPGPRTALTPIENMGGAFAQHALALLAKKMNKIVAGSADEVLDLLPEIDGGDQTEVDVGVLPEEKVKELWAFVRKKEAEGNKL